ncbi:hypothetical protein VTK56DRAFT_1283 [Thermocarpiscus australiensis]
MVRVIAHARSEYLAHAHHSEAATFQVSQLVNLIDQWLDATRQSDRPSAATQTSPQQAQLPFRDAPLENIMAGFNLQAEHTQGQGSSSSAAAATMSAAQDWPPQHLAAPDKRLLQHFKIRDRLAGVTWQNKGAMPKLPDEKTEPLDLRLFLGWLGLAHSKPGSKFALYMAPIAFHENKERQQWYETSGDQSKLFGHTRDFFEYAANAFADGKEMVLGLFTPFFATRDEARAIINNTPGSNRETFNNHRGLRRFGTAVAIRQLARDGVTGIQVALFCPWDAHPWIRDDWKQYEWRLLLWKEKIVTAVDEWAAKHSATVHAKYTGGSPAVRKDRELDSVEMSAGWVLRVVTAPEKTIPGTGEEEDWEWEELCRFRRIES